jgi:hypothetical protein
MKIVMDDGLEVSWREYYAVLATGGYLVIYKEGLTKTSRVKYKSEIYFWHCF